MSRVIIMGVAMALLNAPVVDATVDDALRCRDKKAKATGRKAKEILAARAKNVRSPNPTKLALSVSKAQSKFTRSFEKAEGGGGCDTQGDSGSIEAKVDAFVDDVAGLVSTPPVCGDGDVYASEECDDGNTADGDCCSSTCELEAAGTPCVADADPCTEDTCDGAGACVTGTVCGNGVLDSACGEVCDPPDDSACAGGCLSDCTCPPPGCGNNVLDPGEECDGIQVVPGGCLDPSWQCGAPGSAAECRCCVPSPAAGCDFAPCCNDTDICNPNPGGSVCTACEPDAGDLCVEWTIGGGSIIQHCCPGSICVITTIDELSAQGECAGLTCSVPADCPLSGFFQCEDGSCCRNPGESCDLFFPSGTPMTTVSCCGGASCVLGTCCLDAGAACTVNDECCSESCNGSTSTCDP